MQFNINNASDKPIYQQIIAQVKRDIALGKLAKDEKLPTVRQLAAQLAINPNTIAKAYNMLEQEGIIFTKPGAGTYVASLDSTLSKSVRKKIVCDELEQLIIEAVHMQIDKKTLDEWFTERVEKFYSGRRE